MKKIGSLLSFFILFPISSAQSGEEKVLNNGFKYYEETLTTTVPFEVGFFSKEIKQIQITGILYTPYGDHQKPYPLVLFSHGSQDGGTEFRFVGLSSVGRLLLEKGYAFLLPLRKGFHRMGTPVSDVRADSSEPVACGDYSASVAGVNSAISDTNAILKTLVGKPEIDLTKIILMGQSRGGFLSLALAADGLPGVIKVVNFSGGWYSERCYAEFNRSQIETFGKKIKVPVISFYGGNDSYYSLSHIQQNLRELDRGGMNISHFFASEPHSFWRKIELWQTHVFGAK